MSKALGPSTFVPVRIWWCMIAAIVIFAFGVGEGYVQGLGAGWDHCNAYSRQLHNDRP